MKNNQQLAQDGEPARTRALVLQGLERHATFFSAALPRNVFPPMFNRYAGAANTYGNHVDAAIRYAPAGACAPICRARCSSATRMNTRAATGRRERGRRAARQAAGRRHGALPEHQRAPRRAGDPRRVASFFWVQSMVRSEEQRRLLFEMDRALMHLRSTVGEMDAGVVAPHRHIPQPAAPVAET